MRYKYGNASLWNDSFNDLYDGTRQKSRQKKQDEKHKIDPELDRAGFDPDKLTENEVETTTGQVLAKHPKLPGRITIRNDGRIELIYHRYYDKETKQCRNQKATIGDDISSFLRGMMLPNENYYKYFDRQGQVAYPPLIEELKAEEEKRKQQEEKKRRQEASKQKPDNPDETETTDGTKTTAQKPAKTTKPKTDKPGTDEKETDEAETEQAMEASLLKLQKELQEKEKELKATEEELDRRKQELDEYQYRLENLEAQLEDMKMRKIIEIQEADKDHADLMYSILGSIQETVETHAKKKPDAPMSLKQIQSINELLTEIRSMLAGCETEAYLKLAEEPDPTHDNPGTTYGEMNLLLTVYHSTLHSYRYNRHRW